MIDILKLRNWYKTPLGHTVRRFVQEELDELLPSLRGKRILLVGYGTPYADFWLKEANVFAAMMGVSGGISWPEGRSNRVTLCWGEQLPFVEEQFDVVFVMHALEFSGHAEALLSECRRVLKNDGTVVVVVPNRAGAWCRREVSPFARGLPYSTFQLENTCRQVGFAVKEKRYGLYMPPSCSERVLKHASLFETFGRCFRTPFSGILLFSLTKDMYAGTVVRTESKGILPRFIFKPIAGYNVNRQYYTKKR